MNNSILSDLVVTAELVTSLAYVAIVAACCLIRVSTTSTRPGPPLPLSPPRARRHGVPTAASSVHLRRRPIPEGPDAAALSQSHEKKILDKMICFHALHDLRRYIQCREAKILARENRRSAFN